MATPTWISFPVLPLTMGNILARAGIALADHGCKPARVSALSRADGQPIEVGDDQFPCESEGLAAGFASDWYGLVLSYRARRVRSNLYLYVWPERGGLAPALEIESQALFFTSPLYQEGQWLEQALSALTPAIGAEACAYGNDDRQFRPLEVSALLAALQDGSLVHGHGPAFFLIADDLIARSEIEAARRRSDALASLRYETIGGYHRLSNLLNPLSGRSP